MLGFPGSASCGHDNRLHDLAPTTIGHDFYAWISRFCKPWTWQQAPWSGTSPIVSVSPSWTYTQASTYQTWMQMGCRRYLIYMEETLLESQVWVKINAYKWLRNILKYPCTLAYLWFKYDLGQKYQAPQVQPDWGLNSWPPDHGSKFHVTAPTTRPSETAAWFDCHTVITAINKRFTM